MDSFTSELLLESVFSNAGAGLAVVNDAGVPVKVNARFCRLLGYSEEELLTMPFERFTHPGDVEKDLHLFRELLAGGIDSYEIEKRYIRKDGGVFWVLLTVSVVRQQGEAAIVLGMVQDIDARKHAEAALLESERRLLQHSAYKDRLLSVIAHDLRGPVGNTAQALMYLGKNIGRLQPEKTKEVISKLYSESLKTSELLDNLLTWSHSQFMESNFQPAALPLSEEVTKAIEQLRYQAEQKGVAVEVRVPLDLSVRADEQMLHIVLRNLLSNAIKFSDTGKTVSVSAVAAGSTAHVSVMDQGVGMSSENVARLQGRNPDGFSSYGTKGEKGMGLGINLSAEYIERHGGSLFISSEEGRGSRFTFSIPKA